MLKSYVGKNYRLLLLALLAVAFSAKGSTLEVPELKIAFVDSTGAAVPGVSVNSSNVVERFELGCERVAADGTRSKSTCWKLTPEEERSSVSNDDGLVSVEGTHIDESRHSRFVRRIFSIKELAFPDIRAKDFSGCSSPSSISGTYQINDPRSPLGIKLVCSPANADSRASWSFDRSQLPEHVLCTFNQSLAEMRAHVYESLKKQCSN